MKQLDGQYKSVISGLHSKLGSRVAPPLLHLDAVYLEDGAPYSPSSTTTPGHTAPSSSAQKSKEPWSLLSVLMGELKRIGTQDETVDDGTSQSETSFPGGVSPDWSTASDELTLDDNGNGEELKPSTALLSDLFTSTTQKVAHTETSDPKGDETSLGLQRRPRSILQKRQISVFSGKGTYQTLLALG